MFTAVFRQNGNMVKRFYLEDPVATNILGIMMNPAEAIFRCVVGSINNVDDEVE